MTVKIWGGVLLLAGGGMACCRWIGAQRRIVRRIWALASMLERMEGAIRWQKLTLPRILEQEAAEEISGGYARSVYDLLQSDYTLRSAWREVFSHLTPEESAILCRVELGGDTQQITGALHLAAEQLRHLAAEYTARQGQQERLCVAAGLSLSGLAVILLI